MKNRNKILIGILAILVIILIGVVFYKFQIQGKSYSDLKLDPKKNYSSFEGTVSDIYLEKIYVEVKNGDEKITYTFDDKFANDLNIGAYIKVYFEENDLDEKNNIVNPVIEYLGKARIFESNIPVAVSNSNYQPGHTVYNTFSVAKNSEIDTSIFTQNNGLYLKKITSYVEYLKYKENLPELRELTEDDFIYYYLVILLTDKIDTQYTYSRLRETDEVLNVLVRKSNLLNVSEDSDILYNGLYMVIPNCSDYPEENINIVISD